MIRSSKFKIKNYLALLVVVISLFVAAAQMTYLARCQSVTTDEKVHVPSGFSYWEFGNFYLNPEHPPLAKLLVGLPIYLEKPYYPATENLFSTASRFYYDSWRETRQWGEDFFYKSTNDVEKILFTSRAINIVLSLGLIIFLSSWSYQIAGWSAAALTAVLSAFTPLLLAHGSLANTDLLITLNVAILSYFWWRYLKEKSWRWFLFSAIIFGLCALTKFSFLALIPALFVTSLAVAIKEKNVRFWPAVFKGLIFIAIVWVMIMALFGFSFAGAPEFAGFTQKGVLLNAAAIKAMELFGKVLVPIWYFKGLFMVLGGVIGGRSAYLFGEFNFGGWWYFFPVTILLKTPIAFLVLLGLSLAKIKDLFKKDITLQIVLLGFVLIYLALAMISKTNLGQRHILPIYPLLIVFISQLTLFIKSKWQAVVVLVLVLGNMISVAASYKNQIAYFNEFVGQRNGYKYLLDSNYDWGQSLTRIRDYLNKNKFSEKVYIEYEWASPGEREYYGLSTSDLSVFDPKLDAIIIVGPGSYMKLQNSWLRDLPVIDRIDNTIFVLKYNKSIGDN